MPIRNSSVPTLVDPPGALPHIKRTPEGPLHQKIHRTVEHNTLYLLMSKKVEKKVWSSPWAGGCRHLWEASPFVCPMGKKMTSNYGRFLLLFAFVLFICLPLSY